MLEIQVEGGDGENVYSVKDKTGEHVYVRRDGSVQELNMHQVIELTKLVSKTLILMAKTRESNAFIFTYACHVV